MYLATPEMIPEIDKYAEEVLSLPTRVLMQRAGSAVARAVREITPMGASVLILAGKGNNGGDGYAAACELMAEYSVLVADVFSMGQRSESGRFWREEYLRLGGKTVNGVDADAVTNAETLVDAIFGTGFTPTVSEELSRISDMIRRSLAKKIAVDVPLGVNADDGTLSDYAISVDLTVALSFVKPGLLSYPARASTGRIILDTLGIDERRIIDRFEFTSFATDERWARATLPKRDENGNKGSFGKVLLVTGSDSYRGAAHLGLEAALRGGVGLVSYLGERELCDELRMKYPEAIYEPLSPTLSKNHSAVVSLSKKHKATLVGSGSGCTSELAELIASEGGPLVLDADAINSIAKYGDTEWLKGAQRPIILTPHPLEFSRLSGLEVNYVQSHRIECAKRFASEYNCILVLKGAATLVTDGCELYVNTSGSSALAKAGSGDVLAGLILSLLGFMAPDAKCVALGAYLHGVAGDNLSKILSSYGVTPSDLPREIARVISEFER